MTEPGRTGEVDLDDFGVTPNLALEAGGVLVSEVVLIEIDLEAVLRAD